MTMKVANEIEKMKRALHSVWSDLKAATGQDTSLLEQQAEELVSTLETVWTRTMREIQNLIQDETYEPIRDLLRDVLDAKRQASIRRKAERLVEAALKEAAAKAAERALFKLGARARSRSPLPENNEPLPVFPF